MVQGVCAPRNKRSSTYSSASYFVVVFLFCCNPITNNAITNNTALILRSGTCNRNYFTKRHIFRSSYFKKKRTYPQHWQHAAHTAHTAHNKQSGKHAASTQQASSRAQPLPPRTQKCRCVDDMMCSITCTSFFRQPCRKQAGSSGRRV